MKHLWGDTSTINLHVPQMGRRAPDRQLAAEQGIVAADITRRSSSRSLPANVNARHARFAAACAIDETVCEQPVGAVAQKWGRIGVIKGGELLAGSSAALDELASRL